MSLQRVSFHVLVLLVLFITGTSGCVRNFQDYPGSPLPPEQTALLVNESNGLTLEQVDGELPPQTVEGLFQNKVQHKNFWDMSGSRSAPYCGIGWTQQVALLPGRHTFTVSFSEGGFYSPHPLTISGFLLPGRKYIINAHHFGYEWNPVVYEKAE